MSATSNPVGRISYIDALRGFAIVLVVLGHAWAQRLPRNVPSLGLAVIGFFRIIIEEFGANLTKLRFLGSVTLEIYATHIYFLSAALLLIAQYSLGLLPRVILVFSGALIGALYFQKVIKKIPVLALLMFGRYMPKVVLR